MKQYKKQIGFTLIELLCVTSIIIIISLTAHPSLIGIIEQSKANTDISRLLLLIQTTRLNSINHSVTTVLCPNEDQINCIRNWKLPLMIFNDENKNKKRDASEQILHQFKGFTEEGVHINYPKSQIRFNEAGMANFYNGTMSYCLNQYIEGIVISRVGRIRFAQDLDGDHIPDVNLNNPVTCH